MNNNELKDGVPPEPFGDTEPLQGDDLIKAMSAIGDEVMQWYEDERAIGLKCWFNDTCLKDEVLGEFKGIHSDRTYASSPFVGEDYRDGLDGFYEHCRLAQGDKTPYDGKGQPVPDGVMVKVWHFNKALVKDSQHFVWTQKAEATNWRLVTHYQVQEQPAENEIAKESLAVFNKIYQCPRCSTSMEVDETAKPSASPVTLETIARVVEMLNKYKELMNTYEPFDSKLDELKVDALIEQLSK